MAEIKLKIVPVAESPSPTTEKPEDDNPIYSNVEDGFGGVFTHQELSEMEALTPYTPSPVTSEPMQPQLDRRKDAIMQHFARTSGYTDSQVTRIAETSAGGIMVQGTATVGRRQTTFTKSYSAWEYQQILKRAEQAENSGEIYHE